MTECEPCVTWAHAEVLMCNHMPQTRPVSIILCFTVNETVQRQILIFKSLIKHHSVNQGFLIILSARPEKHIDLPVGFQLLHTLC